MRSIKGPILLKVRKSPPFPLSPTPTTTTTTTTTRLYLDRVKTRITQSSFTRALLIKKRKERNEKEIISIMVYTHNLILMKSTIHANKNVCIYMHNTNIIKSDQ